MGEVQVPHEFSFFVLFAAPLGVETRNFLRRKRPPVFFSFFVCPSCPSGAANKKRKNEWCGACAALTLAERQTKEEKR